MTAAHTPGPWFINTAGSAKAGQPFTVTEIYVFAPDTQDDTAICADVIDPVTQEPSEANARLIAAAPELMEACEAIVAWDDAEKSAKPYVDDGGAAWRQRLELCSNAFDKARAAIAKATGA